MIRLILFLMLVLGIAMQFYLNIYFLTICKIMTMATCGSGFNVGFNYLTEVLEVKTRGRWLVLS